MQIGSAKPRVDELEQWLQITECWMCRRPADPECVAKLVMNAPPIDASTRLATPRSEVAARTEFFSKCPAAVPVATETATGLRLW